MTLSALTVVIPIIGIVLVIFLFFAIWSSRYTKVGPNQVLVISGRQYLFQNPDGTVSRRGYRLVKGGGSFVLPVIEKVDVLSLEPVTVEFRFEKSISGVAQVKINSDDASLPKAAEHFLNKGADGIRETAVQIIESHWRKTGSQKIEEQVARDLATMGLSLLSFSVRSFNETNALISGTAKPPLSATT